MFFDVMSHNAAAMRWVGDHYKFAKVAVKGGRQGEMEGGRNRVVFKTAVKNS